MKRRLPPLLEFLRGYKLSIEHYSQKLRKTTRFSVSFFGEEVVSGIVFLVLLKWTFWSFHLCLHVWSFGILLTKLCWLAGQLASILPFWSCPAFFRQFFLIFVLVVISTTNGGAAISRRENSFQPGNFSALSCVWEKGSYRPVHVWRHFFDEHSDHTPYYYFNLFILRSVELWVL